MHTHSSIAAISTPPGQGGIAVVRISGPDAHSIAAAIFTPINPNKSLLMAKGYEASFGNMRYNDISIDEGISLSFRSPHSYTGEDVVELHCHGGEAVTREVLLACLSAGASPASPGEFTKRAVLNGRLNLAQAEAVIDVISATTMQGVAMANAALSGALGLAVQGHKQALISLAGHLAACVDFPEEDVEILTKPQFLQTLIEAKNGLSTLLNGYEQGLIIRRGVQAAIVGSPNVGKSTLFNLLSGFQRAIVTPLAGTTRDVVREQINIDGIPLILADTAGLHHTEDVIEQEGIKRSYDEIEQASLVIAVFDASQPLGAAEQKLAESCKNRPALALLNKTDLGIKTTPAHLAPYFTKAIQVSAHHPDTRAAIHQAVAQILQVENVDTSAASLSNQRQFSAATQAKNALDEAINALNSGLPYDIAGVCVDDALAALAQLTGENISESIIDSIFENFCVGK